MYSDKTNKISSLRFKRFRNKPDTKSKRTSVFTFFLISYILVLTIPMVTNVMFYNRAEDQMLENVKNTSLAMLEQLMIDMDSKLEIVKNITDNIVFDSKVRMLLEGGHGLYSYRDIMKDLMSKPKYDFIFDYYIYNKRSNEIITSTVKHDAKIFYNRIYTYKDIDFATWHDDYLDKLNYYVYLPKRPLTIYGGIREHQVITHIQTIPVYADKDVLGQVVILIDYSKVSELLDNMNLATDGFIYIIDENDNTIACSMDAPELSKSLKENMDLSTEVINYSNGNVDTVLLYVRSEETGWKYVIDIPERAFLAELNRDKMLTTIFLISCFAINLILRQTITSINVFNM